MFTGIVEEMGRVAARTTTRLTVTAGVVMQDLKLGDSIAINGVCLTVSKIEGDAFAVDIMPETYRRTNLGLLRTGDAVNLERALAVGARLGGHFVQGHVDATGKVLSIRPESDAIIVTIGAPAEVMRYVVPKGFIAVDGVSLTVVDRTEDSFTVSLVKFTQEHITLPTKGPGYVVNLEADILGKYVEQFTRGSDQRRGVSMDLLAEHGYL